MLRKALRDICTISTDETINTENYLDSINYIDNLYHVVYTLKQSISIKKLTFLPSFKGRYICERLGIPSSPEENELKLIRVSSEIFRVDKNTSEKISNSMAQLCKEIVLVDNTFIFKLN